MPDQEIATLADIADQMRNLKNWQKHESVACEDEVNQAIVQYLESSGLEVKQFPLNALYDITGSHFASFDGTYITYAPPTIWAVETKHYLRSNDVRTTMGKIRKLKQLLSESTAYIKSPEHDRNYWGMMALLQQYSDCEVKLVVGGTRVKDDVQPFVKAGKCLLVAPSGRRYSVVS